jgi:acyl dehydratase
VINPSVLGRTYPPTPVYEVGREKIREFADAIRDQNAAYRDPAAARALGYPDVIAPPTFAIVLTLDAGYQVVEDPEVGIDYTRVVHREQRFVTARPIGAGDRLRTTVTIEEIRTVAGNDLITTRADVATDAGEHVLAAYTTLVVRAAGDDPSQ